MNIVGYILLGTLVMCFLIVVIAKITGRNIPKQKFINDANYNYITSKESLLAKQALDNLKYMYDNNLIVSDILSELGIPEHVKKEQNLESLYIFLEFTTIEGWELFTSYYVALSNRISLYNKPLEPIDITEVTLIPKEFCYYSATANLYEEKVTKRSVTYGGLRWQSGMLRAGSLSYDPHIVKDFVLYDSGDYYVTNKRIIFVGKKNHITKSITLDSIVSFHLYKGGILLSIANKKALLLKFQDYIADKNGITFLYDDISKFVIVMNKLQELRTC